MARVRRSLERAEAVMTAPTLALEKLETRAPVRRSHNPILLLVIVTARPCGSQGITERISFSWRAKRWTSSRTVVMSQTLMVLSIEDVTAWFHFPSVKEHICIILP